VQPRPGRVVSGRVAASAPPPTKQRLWGGVALGAALVGAMLLGRQTATPPEVPLPSHLPVTEARIAKTKDGIPHRPGMPRVDTTLTPPQVAAIATAGPDQTPSPVSVPDPVSPPPVVAPPAAGPTSQEDPLFAELEQMTALPDGFVPTARGLFAVVAVHPELAQMRYFQAASDPIAQGVDRVLVALLVACMDTEKGGKAPASGDVEVGEFFRQLASTLTDGKRAQEVRSLLHRFLVSGGGTRRLHSTSALHWLHSALALAGQPSAEVIGKELVRQRCIALSHRRRALGFWAGEILVQGYRASGDETAAMEQQLVLDGADGEESRRGARVAGPLDAFVDQLRGQMGTRWDQLKANPRDQAITRRTLLYGECLQHAAQEARGQSPIEFCVAALNNARLPDLAEELRVATAASAKSAPRPAILAQLADIMLRGSHGNSPIQASLVELVRADNDISPEGH
jgi:hypothetical protein